MLSAHKISPQALYGYHESYAINFDTLDRISLDPFLIVLDIFVTINTVCTLANSSTDLNSTVIWRSLLPEKPVILKDLVKMLDCILLLYQEGM
jgi:hypothetical protein